MTAKLDGIITSNLHVYPVPETLRRCDLKLIYNYYYHGATTAGFLAKRLESPQRAFDSVSRIQRTIVMYGEPHGTRSPRLVTIHSA
jgi:hypothetical protein